MPFKFEKDMNPTTLKQTAAHLSLVLKIKKQMSILPDANEFFPNAWMSLLNPNCSASFVMPEKIFSNPTLSRGNAEPVVNNIVATSDFGMKCKESISATEPHLKSHFQGIGIDLQVNRKRASKQDGEIDEHSSWTIFPSGIANHMGQTTVVKLMDDLVTIFHTLKLMLDDSKGPEKINFSISNLVARGCVPFKINLSCLAALFAKYPEVFKLEHHFSHPYVKRSDLEIRMPNKTVVSVWASGSYSFMGPRSFDSVRETYQFFVPLLYNVDENIARID